MKRIRSRGPVDATLRIPGSKSIGHRALIAAGLAEGTSRILNFIECEDTLLTLNALKELGVKIYKEEQAVVVSGTAGRFPPFRGVKSLFLGNSGTSFRLVLSVAALARGEFLLNGSERMKQRPVAGLVQALNGLGAAARCANEGEFPPVYVRANGIPGGIAKIRGDISSQYVSSLLLAGPYAEKDIEIFIQGDLVSGPYADLTVDVMKRFGVEVTRQGYRYFKIPSGRRYRSRDFEIEGDVSSASYFWAAAAVTGGEITTRNICPHTTLQGDIALLDILEQMGCIVERSLDGVRVSGGPLRGIDADMSSMPDMVPTLSAIALFAKGKTAIRRVPHLRQKESDRLASVAQELGRLGGRVEELPDGLVIHGGRPLSAGVVDPHDDHRMAMSLATIGLAIPGIIIRNERCVVKSFPSFWELFDTI